MIFDLSREVRVGIFSKHTLTEIEINLEDDTRIFYFGKDKTLKRGSWKVKILKDKIQFANNKTVFQAEHILLRSEKAFTVSVLGKGIMISHSYKGSLEFYSREKKMLLVLFMIC